MATKKKTNTISALYKTIDQKQLSDQAKETLKKLRLATGNFRSKDERANEAFSTFYNKLLEKKPTAVKTTKEYKDMVRQRQVEHMKKIREARKEKEESKKGQGNDRDAGRPAKPYGWRLRGKHNYRKPTLKQIRNGEAYYEGRVNRADVKRKKFPMLEKGGYMAKGGMTDHNLMIGDTIKQSFGNILVVENDGKTYLVNINTGQRWTDSEWWSLSKGEITKYTKMAKGGNVYSSDDAYEAIILKDGVEVDRVVLRAKNKGEARMMYEDYHEGKMMKTHGEDITYEIIVAPSKMAMGGEVFYKESHKMGH